MVPSVSKDFSAFTYRAKHSKKNTDTNNSGAGTCTIVSNYVTVGSGGGGELGAHSICLNKICYK